MGVGGGGWGWVGVGEGGGWGVGAGAGGEGDPGALSGSVIIFAFIRMFRNIPATRCVFLRP